MKNVFKLLILALVFTSCEDVEPIVYNGNIDQNKTFVGFSRSVYQLPVVKDNTGSATIVLNVSTVADYDRTYNIELSFPENPDTAANPETFSVPSSITVPAGEYQASVPITGTDNNLVDENVKSFILTITNLDAENEVADSNSTTVNVYEVCPLGDDFTGTYHIQVQANYFTGLPGFKAENVTVSVGATEYERVFTATTYPGYGGAQEVVISLSCGFTNLAEEVDSGVYCTAGTYLVFAPVDNEDRGTYNNVDDSYFTVNMIENSKGTCGGPPDITTLTFTKVD